MTLLTEDRQQSLIKNLLKTRDVDGAIIEVGVFKGGSLKLIAEAAHTWKKQIIGLDTFKGIPQTYKEGEEHLSGRFADTSVALVRKNLEGLPVHLIEGEFNSDNLLSYTPISFAHLDVDSFESNIHCLCSMQNYMGLKGAIVIDDYGSVKTPGIAESVHLFLKNSKDFIVEDVGYHQITLRRVRREIPIRSKS